MKWMETGTWVTGETSDKNGFMKPSAETVLSVMVLNLRVLVVGWWESFVLNITKLIVQCPSVLDTWLVSRTRPRNCVEDADI